MPMLKIYITYVKKFVKNSYFHFGHYKIWKPCIQCSMLPIGHFLQELLSNSTDEAKSIPQKITHGTSSVMASHSWSPQTSRNELLIKEKRRQWCVTVLKEEHCSRYRYSQNNILHSPFQRSSSSHTTWWGNRALQSACPTAFVWLYFLWALWWKSRHLFQ